MAQIEDARSHRIIYVAHCLLNANAMAAGQAHFAGVHAIIGELAGRGYAIVQLPCPEMAHEGCGRKPGTDALYESEEYRALCAALADGVAADVEKYLQCGVKTVAVVGLEGSGTCAVGSVSADPEVAHCAPGVFVEELRTRLDPHGVRFLSISHAEPEDNIPGVLANLR